jgi:hypothetical protein
VRVFAIASTVIAAALLVLAGLSYLLLVVDAAAPAV